MPEVHHGLEGVIAFETQIAEPDKEGSALRYRGVDIEDIVGRVPFEHVWGLLIDGAYTPGLPPAEAYNIPVHTGDVRVDVQAAIAMLAPAFGFGQTYDISDEQAREDLARVAVMVLSYAAQSARGLDKPVVPQKTVDEGKTLAEKFLIRWKGEADPKHVKAIDAYWSSAAEHGMNASTFTARVITSTGADVAAAFSGAIGAMSGPLHGGAPSRVLGMISDVEQSGDADAYVKGILDRGERLMGFGHRVYRAEDPRARVLRRTAKELDAPRYAVAEALEQAALKELRERRPDRVLETNVEFWAAIVLDFAEVPANMFTSMFTCARTGGWSAHILEQKTTGRLIRPSAVYAGPAPRPASDVEGWDDAWARAPTGARWSREGCSATSSTGGLRRSRPASSSVLLLVLLDPALVEAGVAEAALPRQRDVHVVAVAQGLGALLLPLARGGEVVRRLEAAPRGVHLVVPDDVHDPHPAGLRRRALAVVLGEHVLQERLDPLATGLGGGVAGPVDGPALLVLGDRRRARGTDAAASTAVLPDQPAAEVRRPRLGLRAALLLGLVAREVLDRGAGRGHGRHREDTGQQQHGQQADDERPQGATNGHEHGGSLRERDSSAASPRSRGRG